MKGTYLLLMDLAEEKSIRVGKLGDIFFKKGVYLYIGSALNGLEHRIDRHLQRNKKMYWHIDYLLQYAKIKNIYYTENTSRIECKIARTLANNLVMIPNFGCSDCTCQSHLFYSTFDTTLSLIDKVQMKPYRRDENS